MRSHLDFPSLENELESNSEDYTLSHPNWDVAWTALSTAQNLKRLHEFVGETAGNDTDDGKMFQHVLVRQAGNAMESLFLLTRHHQYNSARGRARYLYETYLVLRSLNRDQDRAAEKWNETRLEARDIASQNRLKPLEKQTQALHDFRKEERNRIENEIGRTDAYQDFWRLLSDRGSHPTSIRGSLVDDKHSPESEDSLFRIGLVFAFGITAQYILTFSGTPSRREIHRRADHIIVEIKLALHPMGLPTIFQQELRLWNPGLGKSPFLGR